MQVDSEELKIIIGKAFRDADENRTDLTNIVTSIQGMTGMKIRYFLNRAVKNIGGRHLAIGVLYGATVCSSLFGSTTNKNNVAIDNWRMCGGTTSKFLNNVKKCGIEDLKFVKKDCFSVTKEELEIDKYGKFSSYMYDAEHTLEDQVKALTYYAEYMKDPFVFFCDDYESTKVQLGTKRGIEESNLEVKYEWVRRGALHNAKTGDKSCWWHGFYCAILEKRY